MPLAMAVAGPRFSISRLMTRVRRTGTRPSSPRLQKARWGLARTRSTPRRSSLWPRSYATLSPPAIYRTRARTRGAQTLVARCARSEMKTGGIWAGSGWDRGGIGASGPDRGIGAGSGPDRDGIYVASRARALRQTQAVAGLLRYQLAAVRDVSLGMCR